MVFVDFNDPDPENFIGKRCAVCGKRFDTAADVDKAYWPDITENPDNIVCGNCIGKYLEKHLR